MQITEDIMKKIALDTGVTDVDGLTRAALLSFLKERRMKIKLDILEILDRYGVESASALRSGMQSGVMPEHPAWEDIITLENLESVLASVDDDIKDLQ